jgi:hypothetical protein
MKENAGYAGTGVAADKDGTAAWIVIMIIALIG